MFINIENCAPWHSPYELLLCVTIDVKMSTGGETYSDAGISLFPSTLTIIRHFI